VVEDGPVAMGLPCSAAARVAAPHHTCLHPQCELYGSRSRHPWRLSWTFLDVRVERKRCANKRTRAPAPARMPSHFPNT
jgi:hypothetical protein